MNKIEKAFQSIDSKIDKKTSFLQIMFKGYFPIISTISFGIFLLLLVFYVFFNRPVMIASMIEDDIKLIVLALEKIDKKCNILSIEEDHNDVDFLNVKAFSGSQVGPLNLAHPEQWEGPYLDVNPSIKGNNYEIVKAKDGIFVVPGEGVMLPNGFTVGKDFHITKDTVVAELLKKDGMLVYKNNVFAEKLLFKIGDWDSRVLKQETVEKINEILQEFNEAMPFTKNEIKPNSTMYLC